MDKKLKLTDKVKLNKKAFDMPNSMFWSVEDGKKMEVGRIIAVALKNNPTFLNIFSLYFQFGEDLIN